MQKVRMSVSLDSRVAARVRQRGSESRGGASGYLEHLVRQDELREAADAMADWHRLNPGFAEAAEAERVAADDEAERQG